MELKEKNVDFFKQMLDNVTTGGLFIDRERTIKYCNRNIGEIFGYPLSEIIGARTEFLYGDRRNNPLEESEIYKTLEENGFHIGAARGLTKDKKEIRLQLSTFVIKPNKGAIIFVEEFDKSPEPRIDREKFLQDLLDNIPDMIYFKDLQNHFILVNKAHVDALNLTPEEVIGKSDLDFFPREIAQKYYADDNRVIKTGKPIVGKVEKAQRPDGGITYVSTTKVPHRNKHGKIIGTIGITRNITEKMIAQEELRIYKDRLEELVKERTRELEESNERILHMYNIKSDFTSMVSHELRTPLAIAREGVALIEDETLGSVNEKQKSFLGTVLENIDRLTRLINDILDFSKLETKKMKFKIRKGNINEIIDQVLKSYEVSINKKGLEFNMSLDSSLPLVKFDPDRIAQVVHNLINNAIKFTDKGYIGVESKFDEKEVKVCLTDTGCGIKAEDLPRIFEKFEQVFPEGKARKRGTGLGLAICKQIIEQTGGRIFVESEYEKGSKFSFSLPR